MLRQLRLKPERSSEEIPSRIRRRCPTGARQRNNHEAQGELQVGTWHLQPAIRAARTAGLRARVRRPPAGGEEGRPDDRSRSSDKLFHFLPSQLGKPVFSSSHARVRFVERVAGRTTLDFEPQRDGYSPSRRLSLTSARMENRAETQKIQMGDMIPSQGHFLTRGCRRSVLR